MEALKKTEKVFKRLILCIFVAHISTYFMPIYESVYTSSWNDTKTTTVVYWYGSGGGGSLSYIIYSSTALIVPILAIAFLFANFKNSKVFFFGLSATYAINCIFTLLTLSQNIKENTNTSYEYTFKYGYHFFILTLIFLIAAIIVAFVVYIVALSRNSKIESEQLQRSSDSEIDIIKKKIEILDSLKQQGILTESEYEQKRSAIIEDLKI